LEYGPLPGLGVADEGGEGASTPLFGQQLLDE